jgi:hypothetical protein
MDGTHAVVSGVDMLGVHDTEQKQDNDGNVKGYTRQQ